MKRFFIITSVVTAFTAAFILYALKYDTRVLAERAASLDQRIDELNAAIAIEQAELANLSRPQRLDGLAKRFTQLKPVEPLQLGAIASIPLRVELEHAEAAPAAAPVGSGGEPSSGGSLPGATP